MKYAKLTAFVLAGTGSLFGATAMADSADCTADTDGNGVVDIHDLLEVINQWGTVCDLGSDGGVTFNWLQTEFVGQTLPAGTCVSADGSQTSIQLVPNGGQIGYNFHMQPSTLFHGPKHATDQLKIEFTIDLSNYKNSGPNYATPTIFLCGYGNKTGTATTPINTLSTNGTWYYADSKDAAQNCVNEFTSELDLFEVGTAKIPGQNGLMNVMQVTSHPQDANGNPQEQWGSFIGLQGDNLEDFTGCSGPWSDQLLYIKGTTDNHIGLDMTKPFIMEYTIFEAGMDIKITQPQQSGFGEKIIEFRGSPGPSDPTGGQPYTPPGIADFLMLQYFSLVVSINNGYGPEYGTFCGLEKYTDPSFAPSAWTAEFTNFQYMDGTADSPQWVDCVPVDGYTGGTNNSDCQPASSMPTCP